MGFEWLPAKNYKKHYICLNCQKGFKRASDQDRKYSKVQATTHEVMEAYYTTPQSLGLVQYIHNVQVQQQEICPQCQEGMVQVSYVFEVPRQRDQKAWKELKKRLASKQSIDYQPYLQWHMYQLRQGDLEELLLVRIQKNILVLEQQV